MASVARGGGPWVRGVDTCLRTEGATGRVRRRAHRHSARCPGGGRRSLRATLLAATTRSHDTGTCAGRGRRIVPAQALPAPRVTLSTWPGARVTRSPSGLRLRPDVRPRGPGSGAALWIAVEMLEIGERGEDWELVLWTAAGGPALPHDRRCRRLRCRGVAFSSLADRLRVQLSVVSARWRCVRAIVEGRLDDADASRSTRSRSRRQDSGRRRRPAPSRPVRRHPRHARTRRRARHRDRGGDRAARGAADVALHAGGPVCRPGAEPDARATFEQLAVDDFAWLPRDWDRSSPRRTSCRPPPICATCTSGRPVRAARAVRRLLRVQRVGDHLRRNSLDLPGQPRDRSRALGRRGGALRRGDATVRHLRRPPFLAQTQLDSASMLLQRGEAVDALDLAEQALAGAEHVGMARLVRLATALKHEAEAVLLPVQDTPGEEPVR